MCFKSDYFGSLVLSNAFFDDQSCSSRSGSSSVMIGGVPCASNPMISDLWCFLIHDFVEFVHPWMINSCFPRSGPSSVMIGGISDDFDVPGPSSARVLKQGCQDCCPPSLFFPVHHPTSLSWTFTPSILTTLSPVSQRLSGSC